MALKLVLIAFMQMTCQPNIPYLSQDHTENHNKLWSRDVYIKDADSYEMVICCIKPGQIIKTGVIKSWHATHTKLVRTYGLAFML